LVPWVSRSRPGTQLAIAIGATVVGLLLMYGARGFQAGGQNVLAGFLLGVMLLLIGIAAAVVSGPQTVTVDPRIRRIEVADSYVLGTRQRSIAFSEVREVSIGFLGKSSNYVRTYYLVLHLVDGHEYPLFAPGRFYEGASDRSVVEGWRQRLEEYLVAAPVRT
jgi:hypothetical protein